MVRRTTQPSFKCAILSDRRVFRRTITAFSSRRRAALCLHAPEAAHGVSRLPAGTLSGPGRSPGAARVRGCEPRPRAPYRSCAGIARPCPGELPPNLRQRPPLRPALTTPHDSAPRRTRWKAYIPIIVLLSRGTACPGLGRIGWGDSFESSRSHRAYRGRRLRGLNPCLPRGQVCRKKGHRTLPRIS
jgi:hypothetical protein